MIGFSCPPLAVRPFEEVAELVVPNFEHWEIISEANHFLLDIERPVRELLETSYMRLSVHAPYSDINLAAFDERTRKQSVRTLGDIIKLAHKLGIGPVTVHPGVIHPIQTFDRQRAVRLTRKSLEELASIAWDCSTTIALENMPLMKFTTCQTAAEMREMLHGLEIRMCLDVGHAHTANQLDELLELRGLFANVHVHDNNGERDEHLELGKGTVNLKALATLRGTYRGNYIIEAKDTDMASALASKDFLSKLLG